MHIWFKGKVKSFNPFPGVEIKARGGYVVAWKHPAPLGRYEDFQSLYNDLPEFFFEKWGKEKEEERKFGPGKNNKAIPQRAARAGVQGSIPQVKKDMIEMIEKNKGRDWDFKKHVSDYFNVFEKNYNPAPPPPLSKEETDKELKCTETRTLTVQDIRIPEAFIQDFLLHHDFNFIGGPTKLGKAEPYWHCWHRS